MEEGKNKKLYKEPISGYKFKINQKKKHHRESPVSPYVKIFILKKWYFNNIIFIRKMLLSYAYLYSVGRRLRLFAKWSCWVCLHRVEDLGIEEICYGSRIYSSK